MFRITRFILQARSLDAPWECLKGDQYCWGYSLKISYSLPENPIVLMKITGNPIVLKKSRTLWKVLKRPSTVEVDQYCGDVISIFGRCYKYIRGCSVLWGGGIIFSVHSTPSHST